MESGNWKNRIKEHGLVLLFFVALTLVLTYPLITHLTTYTVGGADTFIFKWNVWHVNQALMEGGGISDLYHTDLLYYPDGANLVFHNLTLTNTLFLAFPLTLLTDNIVLIYNLLILFNFIMAGYAMYLLVKYLVKDKAIAFLVGFAYTFAPLHMVWGVSFLPEMSFLWTPLFLLFFFKMFEEEKLRNAIIAAIFLFFLALAGWYHLIFAFFIAAPYFIYRLVSSPSLPTLAFFTRTALLLLLFGVAILPFVFPMIFAYFGGEHGLPNYFTEITLLHYVLPNPFHPLWGERVLYLGGGEIFGGWGPLSRTVAPGYLVIFISLLYLVKTRKHLFWILLAIFFSLVSVNFQGIGASFVGHIPFVNVVGQLHFYSFVVLFSILLFFAFALAYFLPKWKKALVKRYSFSTKYVKSVLFLLIFAVLTGEYVFTPNYPTAAFSGPCKAKIESAEKIGQVVKGPHPAFDDDFSVLALPAGLNLVGGQAMLYFQTFNGKPIIGGDISRPPVVAERRLREIKKIFRTGEVSEIRQLLEKYKVGYIIVFDSKLAGVYLGGLKPERAIVKEEALSSLYLVPKIPGEFVFTRPGAFYVYEVWPEK